MIEIKKIMLCFSDTLKVDKSRNGSAITPIKHGKDWLLPLGFQRVLSNAGIDFEEIEIVEEVEDPNDL